MTPEQALANLDQAAAQLSASREVHHALQHSVDVLRRALAEKRDDLPVE